MTVLAITQNLSISVVKPFVLTQYAITQKKSIFINVLNHNIFNVAGHLKSFLLVSIAM